MTGLAGSDERAHFSQTVAHYSSRHEMDNFVAACEKSGQLRSAIQLSFNFPSISFEGKSKVKDSSSTLSRVGTTHMDEHRASESDG